MTTEVQEEKLFENLRESALRRFGEERAILLEPAIRGIVRSILSVAQYPHALEEEPSFFG